MNRKPPTPLTVKELEQIKALRASGLTYHAISKEINRDPKTVKKACLEPETAQEIQEIREELGDFFEDLAKRMITSITDEDIQKINAYQRTVSAGISTDKMRLLRDQSTDNIAVAMMVNDLAKEMRARRGMMRTLPTGVEAKDVIDKTVNSSSGGNTE